MRTVSGVRLLSRHVVHQVGIGVQFRVVVDQERTVLELTLSSAHARLLALFQLPRHVGVRVRSLYMLLCAATEWRLTRPISWSVDEGWVTFLARARLSRARCDLASVLRHYRLKLIATAGHLRAVVVGVCVAARVIWIEIAVGTRVRIGVQVAHRVGPCALDGLAKRVH